MQDPYEIEKPKQTFLSNSGRHRIHINDGRYRVFDVTTGAKLVDRAGYKPNLSPTERFVIADVGAQDGERFEVIDLISGDVIDAPQGPFIGWLHHDAFMVDGLRDWGRLKIRPTLVSRSSVSSVDDLYFSPPAKCHFCPSWRDAPFIVDLDNGVVILSAGLGSKAYGSIMELATGYNPVITIDGEGLEDNFKKNYEIMPLAFDKGWRAREVIQFSHIDEIYKDVTPSHRTQLSGLQKLTRLTRATHQHAALNKAGVVRGDWRTRARPRGASAMPFNIRDRLFDDLNKFGVRTANANVSEAIQFSNYVDIYKAGELLSYRRRTKEERARLSEDIDKRTMDLKKAIARDIPALKHDLFRRGKSDIGFPRSKNKRLVPGSYEIEGAWRWEIAGRPIWLIQLLGQTGGSSTAVMARGYLFDGATGAGSVVDLNETFGSLFRPRGLGTKGDDFATAHKRRLKPQIYFDRFLVIASVVHRAIAVYDLHAKKKLAIVNEVPQADLLVDVRLTSDRRHIIQINSDGQFFVHEIETGRTILSGRSVDNELILYTFNGYYWASYEGAHFVQLRFPGLPGLYSFQQFAPILNRPDLVRSTIEGRRTDIPTPNLTSPPTLEILHSESVGQTEQRVTVRARAVSQLALLRVFLDGQPFQNISLSGSEELRQVKPPPAGHARWLTVVAIDERGFTSRPLAIQLRPGRKRSNRLFALLVGVDTYGDQRLNLRYAASDARRLAEALQENLGKYYSSQSVKVRLDKDATISAIMSDLKAAVETASIEDTIVLSFAGHGFRGPNDGYYLTPAGFRLDRITSTGLAWSKIAALLQSARARVVVLLDSCQSGFTGEQGLVTNDDAAASLLVGARSPMLVLAASKGRQDAEEHKRWGGGVFTFALANVLLRDRKKYDLNGNDAIEVSELYKALRLIVARETNGRQTPWLARQDLVGDFTLF